MLWAHVADRILPVISGAMVGTPIAAASAVATCVTVRSAPRRC
jgi:hypothetical protein